MALYQYNGEHGKLVLQNLQLKVTPPNEFNDPFEMSPIVKCADPKAYAVGMAKKALLDPSFFDHHRTTFPDCATFTEFQTKYGHLLPHMVKTCVTAVPDLDSQLQEEVLDTLSRSTGVVCMTRNPNNLLMWAHYAAQHKGILIEFDEGNPLLDCPDLFDVEYSVDRASYDPTGNHAKDVETFAKRKSAEWDYEAEVRLIVQLDHTIKHTRPDGSIMYLLAIPPELVVSVTFGIRTSDALKKEINATLADAKFGHARIFQAIRSKMEFKLETERLK